MKTSMFVAALFVMIFLAGSVSAWELNPFAEKLASVDLSTPDKTIPGDFIYDKVTEYPVLRISNTFLWITTDKVAEYKLERNTKLCLANCEFYGKVVLYKDSVLFDDVQFKTLTGKDTSIKSSKYLLKTGTENYTVKVPSEFKEVCELIKGNATNHTEDKTICQNETIGWKDETRIRDVWSDYRGEELRAGEYEWKLQGVKDPYQSVDAIPIAQGKVLSEWATWTSSFNTNIQAYWTYNETSGASFTDIVGGKIITTTDLHPAGIINNSYGPSVAGKWANTTIPLKVGTMNVWLYRAGAITGSYWGTSYASNNYPAGLEGGIGFGNDVGNIDVYAGFADSTAGKQWDVTIPQATWHMLTVVYNDSAICLYVNGSLYQSCKTKARSVTDGHSWVWFSESNGSYPSSGHTVDENSFWNRTLSASEITDLYNGGAGLTYVPTYVDTSMTLTTSLISPVNMSNFTNSNINFSVNATYSYGNLTNMTLLVWNSANALVVDKTNATVGIAGAVALTNTSTFNIASYSLGDGVYNWTAYSCAENGTTLCTRALANRTFTIDGTKPSLSIVYPLNQTYGIPGLDELNYTVADLHIQACSNSTDGVNYSPVTCGTNLTGLTPAQGTNVYYMKANDSLGNENVSSVQFFLDTVMPLIDYGVGTAVDNKVLSQTFIYINTTSTETNFKNITFRISGAEQMFTTATQNYTFTSLADGTYKYNVTLCDVGNNCNTTDTRTIVLDTLAPSTLITYPDDNGNYSYKPTELNFTITHPTGTLDVCWYSLDSYATNVTLVCGTNKTGLSANEGTNTWSACANDTGGNEGCHQHTFFVDTVFPTISITYPQNTSYNYGVTELNYTTYDLNINKCWYSTNSYATNTSVPGGCGNNITGLASVEGTNIWNVCSNDTLGNENCSSVQFFTDVTPPAISIQEPKGVVSYLISGSGIHLNTTLTDGVGLGSCWYRYNGVNNSFDCQANGQGFINRFINDTYDWGEHGSWSGATTNATGSASKILYKGNSSKIANVTFDSHMSCAPCAGKTAALNFTFYYTDGSTGEVLTGSIAEAEAQYEIINPQLNKYIWNFSITPIVTSDTGVDLKNVYFTQKNEYNITFTYVTGQDYIEVWSNDTTNNVGNATSTWMIAVTQQSVVYNATTTIGALESYKITITNHSSFAGATAKINYNGALYDMTKANNAFTWSQTITGASGARPFSFVFTNGTTNITSGSFTQTVNEVQFAHCNATLTVPYANFSFKDENGTIIKGIFDASNWEYWFNTATTNLSYSYANPTEQSNYSFCASPSGVTLGVTSSIQYSNTGYPVRNYQTATTYTNTTTEVVLYLISSSTGIYQTIQTINLYGTPIQGVLITAQRNIGGALVTVSQQYTDSAGATVMFLNPNFEHTITASKTGYAIQVGTITPSTNPYTIVMVDSTANNATYNYSLKGITWKVSPSIGEQMYGLNYFAFNVTSTRNNLAACRFELTNYTDGVLNSSIGIGNGSDCKTSVYYNVAADSRLRGRISLLLTGDPNWYILDQDQYWVFVDINTSSSYGLKGFFSDLKTLSDFGDTGIRQQYSRIVFFFFVLVLLVGLLTFFTGLELNNPGTAVMVVGPFFAIAGAAGYWSMDYTPVHNITGLISQSMWLTNNLAWIMALFITLGFLAMYYRRQS